MGKSSTILGNLFVNRLDVNKLRVIALKETILKPTISFLFSLILHDSSFDENSNILTLRINNNIDSMITFTDRPIKNFKINKNIVEDLKILFNTISFQNDPPNGVIIYNNNQYPYQFILNNIYDDIIEFKCNPLKDDVQNIYDLLTNYKNEKISIFIDNLATPATKKDVKVVPGGGHRGEGGGHRREVE